MLIRGSLEVPSVGFKARRTAALNSLSGACYIFFSAMPALVYVMVIAFCILLASGPISMVMTNESGLKSE